MGTVIQFRDGYPRCGQIHELPNGISDRADQKMGLSQKTGQAQMMELTSSGSVFKERRSGRSFLCARTDERGCRLRVKRNGISQIKKKRVFWNFQQKVSKIPLPYHQKIPKQEENQKMVRTCVPKEIRISFFLHLTPCQSGISVYNRKRLRERRISCGN